MYPLPPDVEKPSQITSRFLRPHERKESSANMIAQPYSTMPERITEDVWQSGNPAAPLPPGDFHECGLTALWEKLIHVMYADDGWVEETRDP